MWKHIDKCLMLYLVKLSIQISFWYYYLAGISFIGFKQFKSTQQSYFLCYQY